MNGTIVDEYHYSKPLLFILERNQLVDTSLNPPYRLTMNGTIVDEYHYSKPLLFILERNQDYCATIRNNS